MNTIDQAITILQAIKEGKQIQIMLNGEWQDREASQKDKIPHFSSYQYRIRPEPRVFWANVYKDVPGTPYLYKDKTEARSFCGSSGETIKVVEVIE